MTSVQDASTSGQSVNPLLWSKENWLKMKLCVLIMIIITNNNKHLWNVTRLLRLKCKRKTGQSVISLISSRHEFLAKNCPGHKKTFSKFYLCNPGNCFRRCLQFVAPRSSFLPLQIREHLSLLLRASKNVGFFANSQWESKEYTKMNSISARRCCVINLQFENGARKFP